MSDFEMEEAYTIYSKDGCGYCDRAKAAILERGERYTEFKLPKEEVQRLVGRPVATYPVILYNGQYIGGYQELMREYAKRDLSDLASVVF